MLYVCIVLNCTTVSDINFINLGTVYIDGQSSCNILYVILLNLYLLQSLSSLNEPNSIYFTCMNVYHLVWICTKTHSEIIQAIKL